MFQITSHSQLLNVLNELFSKTGHFFRKTSRFVISGVKYIQQNTSTAKITRFPRWDGSFNRINLFPISSCFSSNSDLFSAPQMDPIFVSGRRQHTCDAFITADEVVHELVLPHHHGLLVVNPDARPDGRGGPCSGSGKKDDTGGTPPGEGSGEPTTGGCPLPGVSPPVCQLGVDGRLSGGPSAERRSRRPDQVLRAPAGGAMEQLPS